MVCVFLATALSWALASSARADEAPGAHSGGTSGGASGGIVIASPDEQAVIVIADNWKQSVWSDWGAHGILRQFIGEQTGRQLRVVKDSTVKRDDNGLPVPAQGVRIWAGRQPEVDRVIGKELDALDVEGFIIKAVGRDVYIAGRTPAASNYAAHDFLERFSGCRWYGPEPRFWQPKEDGVAGLFDHIPKMERITIPADISITEQPAYKMRYFRPTPLHSFRLSYRDKFHHNFAAILPAEKYAQSHPEYYSMVDGKRQVPGPGGHYFQPCVGNPDVFQITLDAALAALRKGAPSFSLGMNDNNLFCEAPESIANAPASITDIKKKAMWAYFDFCNRVAARVAQEFPDARLGLLGYAALQSISGEDFKLHPNIVVYATRDSAQLFDANEVREFKETLSAWHDRASHMGVYEYIYGGQFVIPRIYNRYIIPNIQNNYGGLTDGFYAEAYPNWGLDGPKYYLIARMLWNNKLDPDALLAEYYDLMFGPAAGQMKQYFDYLEEVWCTQTIPSTRSNYRWMGSPEQLNIFTPEICDKAWAMLQQARAKVAGDELQTARVDYIAKSFAVTRSLSHRKAAAEAFDTLQKTEPAEGHLVSPQALAMLSQWLKAPSIEDAMKQAAALKTAIDPLTLTPRIIRNFDRQPVAGFHTLWERAITMAQAGEASPASAGKLRQAISQEIDRALKQASDQLKESADRDALRQFLDQALAQRGVMQIPWDDAPVTIDGKLSPGEYPQPVVSGHFYRSFGLDQSKAITTVYAKRSADKLYVAFDLPQDVANLGGVVTENEAVGSTRTRMQKDDAVAVFFYNSSSGNRGVRINANGAVGLSDPAWKGLKASAVDRRDDGWSVELEFDANLIPALKNNTFRMPLARYIRTQIGTSAKPAFEAEASTAIPVAPLVGIIQHGNHVPLMNFISGPLVVNTPKE